MVWKAKLSAERQIPGVLVTCSVFVNSRGEEDIDHECEIREDRLWVL